MDDDASQAVRVANTLAEVFVTDLQVAQQEPYGELLADTQAQMDELGVSIDETQAAIDSLSATKIEVETDLAYQGGLLAQYRSESLALQQDYDDLQMVADLSPLVVGISEPATVPTRPIRPRTLLTTALAAAVGLVVGAGVAFLLEYFDDTIRTPDDVRHALGVSTLGTIGRLPKGDSRLVVATNPSSYLAESFRMLLTNIRSSSLDRPLRTLLVTSPDASAGKSFIVANLATVAARCGLGVVAVDADLRQPSLQQCFGLDAGEGLVDSLLEGSLDGRLMPTAEEALQILRSGAAPPANPGELVGSRRMQSLLEELAQDSDLVLIDSPPVLLVADASSLASMVDGVLLVLNAGQTRRQEGVRAMESLRQVGGRVVGVVLNRMPPGGGGYYTAGQDEKEVKRLQSGQAWAKLQNAYRKQA
jgi:capsular exopolysaccharide synthesis family protein